MKGNEPAFPGEAEKFDTTGARVRQTSYAGLTKREYFAGLAMHGVAATFRDGPLSIDDIAKYSVQWADALIAELNKEPT